MTEIHSIEVVQQKEKQQIVAKALDGYFVLLDEMGISLQHSKQEVHRQAQRFSEFLDLECNFFSSEEGKIRPILLIGLADSWLKSSNALEKQKSIIELLKVVAGQDQLPGRGGTSAAKEVERLAKLNYRIAYEYVSGLQDSATTYESEWKAKRDYATSADNIDTEKTTSLYESISITNSESPLRRIRDVLGVTSNTERPFRISVLKLTTAEMVSKYNGNIAFFSDGVLCLPNDFDFHLVEHEYIHSQQAGINFGASKMLGRGLMEAWTEQQTEKPVYYELQREILNHLFEEIPKLKESIERFGKVSTIGNLDAFWGRILDLYGIEGILTILRIAPDLTCLDEFMSPYYHGTYIFVAAKEAEGIFKHKLTESNEAVWQKYNNAIPLLESDIDVVLYNLAHESDEAKKKSLKLKFEKYTATYLVERLKDTHNFEETQPLIGELAALWLANRNPANTYLLDMANVLCSKFPESAMAVSRIMYKLLTGTSKDVVQCIRDIKGIASWWTMDNVDSKNVYSYWKQINDELVDYHLSMQPDDLYAQELKVKDLSLELIDDSDSPTIVDEFTHHLHEVMKTIKLTAPENISLHFLGSLLGRILFIDVINKLPDKLQEEILDFVIESLPLLEKISESEGDTKLTEYYREKIQRALAMHDRAI